MEPGILFVLIFITLFGLLVYISVRNERKRKQSHQQRLQALGFTPANPDLELFDRLMGFQSRANQRKLEVLNVFEKSGLDHVLYMFDMKDHSGNESDIIFEAGLAVLSPYLHMPRFTLSYRIEESGRMAQFANMVLDKLNRQQGKRVIFESHPEFNQRYTVTGEDEQAIRQFFAPDRLARLNATRYWMVQAEGDLFMFDQFSYEPDKRRVEKPDLEEKMRLAMDALQIFL